MSQLVFCLFVCLFVCLSLVKVVKSFATWQHLAARGGLPCRLRYTCSLERYLSHRSYSRVIVSC